MDNNFATLKNELLQTLSKDASPDNFIGTLNLYN